ncbi:biotin transporter BioY [Jannaschia sp. KMU-145]|uniref:biotin transporter BioY n=1 Tax=Jannaschia halovivens TaxID=3388667 RepID=UPI00396B05D0
MTQNMQAVASTSNQWSLGRKAALVAAGTVLIALAAQVSIPFFPVPLTLQGLAILTIGLTLGARLGAVTVLAYLAEGAMGLPVFANGGAGLAYLAGPTGGFLLGFVAMAYIAGLAAGRGLVVMIGASLLAAAAIYLPGVAWPYAVASAAGIEAGWASTSAAALWSGWVAPFLLGDAVKAVLAALIVTGGRRALAARRDA